MDPFPSGFAIFELISSSKGLINKPFILDLSSNEILRTKTARSKNVL